MTASTYHLAQLNIGRLAAPLDSAQLADFVAGLDPVNSLADAAPGFVWRLQGDGEGNATSFTLYDDRMIIVNMSVWTDREALWDFVYDDAHRALLRRRREFFERMAEAYAVLWWVPAGHRPTLAEAKRRLDHLREHGPSAHAFGFGPKGDGFAAPDAAPAVTSAAVPASAAVPVSTAVPASAPAG